MEELNFWKNKSENLNSICQQLSSERIKKVLKFLEQNKSTYTSTFSKLQKEVQGARTEANENCKYLRTLKNLFTELMDTGVELENTQALFVPIMHTILMIWTYSSYYNTPARLVVLIREICNQIILNCHNYVNGDRIKESIAAETPHEAHGCLELCI
jgi:dynein heavy chain